MPKSLRPSSVAAPAFYGLNSQRKADILPFQWATKAENCVFDDSGRIAARKGYKHTNTTAISASPSPRAGHEYIDASGNTLIIVAAGNAIYKRDGTSLTAITGTITTPTADNWKFVNFNGKCIGVQAGHAPIVLSTVGGSFANIAYTAQAPTNPNEALAAFGRMWYLDGNNLEYSDLLDETNGAAGYGLFDLSTVWPSGMDVGTGLAEFNGYLVIFGKNSILVYSNPWVPTGTGSSDISTMELVESIKGIGCIARDSIRHIGTDILFLSAQGIRSLGRTIQEKSMPVNDISKNVNDDLNTYVANETLDNIKSCYSKKDGFYLLTLPTANKTYYFDLRGRLQDGSFKATLWTTSFTCMFTDIDDTVFLGTAGFLNTYTGYTDAVLSDDSGGTSYDLVYESGWNDLGQEVSALNKLPKKLAVLVLGGSGQTVVCKWAFDFNDVFSSFSKTIDIASQARYGIAQYGIDTYSGKGSYNRIKAPMSKSGQVIKFGVNVTINDANIALQQIDMYSKIGRIAV